MKKNQSFRLFNIYPALFFPKEKLSIRIAGLKHVLKFVNRIFLTIRQYNHPTRWLLWEEGTADILQHSLQKVLLMFWHQNPHHRSQWERHQHGKNITEQNPPYITSHIWGDLSWPKKLHVGRRDCDELPTASSFCWYLENGRQFARETARSSVFCFGIQNVEDAQSWRTKVHASNNPSIANLNPVAQEQERIPQRGSSLKLKSQRLSFQ